MLTTLLYIIPFFLVVGVAAYLFNQQQKKATANIDMDALRQDKAQVSNDLLDKQLPYLKKWMKESPVDAYTSATLPTDMGDFIKTAVKDTIKKSLTYSHRNTVETPSFFILSGTELHYISTDQQKYLSEHIVFDAQKLSNAEIKFAGAKKEMGLNVAAISGSDHPKVYTIALDSMRGKTTLQAIDRVVNASFVNVNMIESMKGGYAIDMAKAKITSEYFFEKLGNLYPNLKVGVIH